MQVKTALAKNVDPDSVDAEAAAKAFQLDESMRARMRELFRRSDEVRYSGGQNGDGAVSDEQRRRGHGTNRNVARMKRSWSCTIVAIWVTLLASFARGATEDATAFAKANQDYAAGHYKQAIDGYESLIRTNQSNAVLFYNLGNAWFRKGDPGRAILQYERALALDRQHPEAQANLHLVRDEARALELPKTRADRYLGFATSDQYVWTAAIAFWIAIFALAVLLLGSRRSGATIAVLVGALLVFGGAAYACYAVDNGPQGRAVAIVTGKNIQARLATADTAGAVLALPAGSEVKILSTRGEWVYAALPNNLNGWIPAASIEPIRIRL